MDSQNTGKYSGAGDKPDLNNHSNQCNPNHDQYKGYTDKFGGANQADRDNHANQNNPNHPSYKSKK